jgi:membrane protein implicated in regulation of membrane protease activity
MIFRILFFSFILIMVELYAFQALRTLIKLKWVLVSYQVISVLFLYIIYSFLQFDRSVGQTKQTLYDG